MSQEYYLTPELVIPQLSTLKLANPGEIYSRIDPPYWEPRENVLKLVRKDMLELLDRNALSIANSLRYYLMTPTDYETVVKKYINANKLKLTIAVERFVKEIEDHNLDGDYWPPSLKLLQKHL